VISATLLNKLRVEAEQALYSILAEFRKGHSHMAAVVIRRRRSADHADNHKMMMSRSAAADGIYRANS
jgi:hypothetical protein